MQPMTHIYLLITCIIDERTMSRDQTSRDSSGGKQTENGSMPQNFYLV